MTRMTRIFFVLVLNYSAERVLRDLRFFCENLREKNMDDADFWGTRIFWGTRMTRMTRIFFVLFLNYSAERVLRDLRFFCENLREKNMDDADFWGTRIF
jgi:hypothetical protein